MLNTHQSGGVKRCRQDGSFSMSDGLNVGLNHCLGAWKCCLVVSNFGLYFSKCQRSYYNYLRFLGHLARILNRLYSISNFFNAVEVNDFL